MQKSGFPKMRHYVGFSQIGSHIFYSKMQIPGTDEESSHQLVLARLIQHVLCWGLVEFH